MQYFWQYLWIGVLFLTLAGLLLVLWTIWNKMFFRSGKDPLLRFNIQNYVLKN